MAQADDEPLLDKGAGYGLFGIGYTTFLSQNSPCKNAINLHLNYGSPVMNDNALLDLGFNCNIGLKSNDPWVYHAFNKNAAYFKSTGGGGISYTLMGGLLPTVLNKKGFAIIAGPQLGIGYVTMPIPETDSGICSFKDYAMITINYGLKAYLFIGHRFFIRAEYLNCLQNTAMPAINDNPLPAAKINYSQLQLGIGYKFFEY